MSGLVFGMSGLVFWMSGSPPMVLTNRFWPPPPPPGSNFNGGADYYPMWSMPAAKTLRRRCDRRCDETYLAQRMSQHMAQRFLLLNTLSVVAKKAKHAAHTLSIIVRIFSFCICLAPLLFVCVLSFCPTLLVFLFVCPSASCYVFDVCYCSSF